MKVERPENRSLEAMINDVGRLEHLRGYVTTYESVAEKSAGQLERALGFSPGALGEGYLFYELVAPVNRLEFEWKDRTNYSDGWHWDPTINEYVQRRDELRAHYGRLSDWSEQTTDAQLEAFFERHRRRLNVRSGRERIVKVVPRSPVEEYPDSPVRNLPQWRLTVLKEFRLVAEVAAGGVVP